MGILRQFIEDARRITAAKERTADNKVVLVCDLQVEAINPAFSANPKWHNMLGSDGEYVVLNLAAMAYKKEEKLKTLPFSELKEQSKSNLETLATIEAKAFASQIQFFSVSEEQDIEAVMDQARQSGGFIYNENPNRPRDIFDEMLDGALAVAREYQERSAHKEIMESHKKLPHMAIDVSDIALAIKYAGAKFPLHGLARFEQTSLLKGQGAIVADFWEAVADLPDYSGSFPDRKPPKGNDRNNRKDGLRLPEWVRGGSQPVTGSLIPVPVRG